MNNYLSLLTKGLKFDSKSKRGKGEQDKATKAEEAHCQPKTSESTDDGKALFSDANEAASYRKAFKIRVFGNDIPNPFKAFKDLFGRYAIPLFMQELLTVAEFQEPTAIQKQAIPILLHKRDIMACAPTGSGKTLAFMIPILSLLQQHETRGFRALIVVPTRELAQQMEREFMKLSGQFKVCLLSKASLAELKSCPSCSYDILISTPLYLINGIGKKMIDLSNLEVLILDEADKLLEMRFLEQTDKILAACSDTVLKGLFTATLPSSIETLANTFMRDPIRVFVGAQYSATETISQKLLFVGQEEGKIMAVRQLLKEGINPPVLIFVDSVERADELFTDLSQEGVHVDVIHAARGQAERVDIVRNFRIGKIWVLVTTEILARGIDFKAVRTVINFDFPKNAASYIHRIGRTGRAGKMGEAITLFTTDDRDNLKTIANVMKASGCDVPEYLLELKKVRKRKKGKFIKSSASASASTASASASASTSPAAAS